jgi:carboxypeptidase PM20D1
MDVVPVDPSTERGWTYPPFSGRIADGYIWGRGAMDDKISVLGLLEAVEHLLREGFQPQRTIYLAFGHDEEIGGQNGAAKIAALLRDRQVGLDFVLDEGGNVTDGIVAGISSPVALIGIAEKGYLNLELTVNSPGGHASTPPAHTAIGILSSAIHKLERASFPSRLTEPTRKLFEFIGSEMGSAQRVMVANLWLFEPWVRQQMENSPLAGAMIRTTQAATIFEAGIKENILPVRARVVINYRLLPGETAETVVEHVRKIIANPQIEVTQLRPSFGPSPVSDTESDSFTLLQRTIRQIAPHAIVAPFLLVAATDSRYYLPLTKNIYRFLPITIRAEDAKRYHGVDERVSVSDYEQCVRFFIQLIRNANTVTPD